MAVVVAGLVVALAAAGLAWRAGRPLLADCRAGACGRCPASRLSIVAAGACRHHCHREGLVSRSKVRVVLAGLDLLLASAELAAAVRGWRRRR